MKSLYLSLGLLACMARTFALHADEYLYPVGAVSGESLQVYVLHQKSLDDVVLLSWNPFSGQAHPVLLSRYTPAFFSVLPDASGFSFFDRGCMHIKSFGKRSPQSIPLYEPICDFNAFVWVDAQHFCFAGNYHSSYGIFEGSTSGACRCLLHDPQGTVEYLYPQVCGDKLFCIARRKYGSHAVICTPYPARDATLETPEQFDGSDDAYEQVAKLIAHDHAPCACVKSEACTAIAELNDWPCAFLQMVSDREGFVIQHPPAINSAKPVVQCVLWRLRAALDGSWHCTRLFAFGLPTSLLLGDPDTQLYESILPLLPRYAQGQIFYVDTNEEAGALVTRLHSYNVLLGMHTLLATASPNEPLLAPLQEQQILFYGGRVAADDAGEESALPRRWFDENGQQYLHMPSIYC